MAITFHRHPRRQCRRRREPDGEGTARPPTRPVEEALPRSGCARGGRPRQYVALAIEERECNPATGRGTRTAAGNHDAFGAPGLCRAAQLGLFRVDLRTSERIVSTTSASSATSTEGIRVVKVFLVD